MGFLSVRPSVRPSHADTVLRFVHTETRGVATQRIRCERPLQRLALKSYVFRRSQPRDSSFLTPNMERKWLGNPAQPD